MTTADEPAERIAALQKHLAELDRERTSILDDMAKLGDRTPSPVSTHRSGEFPKLTSRGLNPTAARTPWVRA
jgi:hypothetical protein